MKGEPQLRGCRVTLGSARLRRGAQDPRISSSAVILANAKEEEVEGSRKRKKDNEQQEKRRAKDTKGSARFRRYACMYARHITLPFSLFLPSISLSLSFFFWPHRHSRHGLLVLFLSSHSRRQIFLEFVWPSGCAQPAKGSDPPDPLQPCAPPFTAVPALFPPLRGKASLAKARTRWINGSIATRDRSLIDRKSRSIRLAHCRNRGYFYVRSEKSHRSECNRYPNAPVLMIDASDNRCRDRMRSFFNDTEVGRLHKTSQMPRHDEDGKENDL